MSDNQYQTILEALKAAEAKGFRYRFAAEKDQLRCIETGDLFSGDDVRIEAFHRVEGNSDPEESAILYLIQTSSGLKGTLTDSYGAYANAEISELIKEIAINRHETAGKFESKGCLNCGTMLQGDFCYQCGQKDEHLHEPFYIMVAHAIAHYWHFDSKFFNTFGPLIFRPGFLTKEFIEGRRVRYVHPVQLYFFISIVFFIVFASVAAGSLNSAMESADFQPADPLLNILDSAKIEMDSVETKAIDSAIKKLIPGNDFFSSVTETKQITDSSADADSIVTLFEIGNSTLPKTIEEYDDSIKRLASTERPGTIKQWFDHILIRLGNMDRHQMMENFSENITHNLPKLMFVLIPIFALILKLIYIRRKIYFVDHAIFTLHFHAFSFLVMLLLVIIYLLTEYTLPGGWLLLLLFAYLYISMKNFYGQSFFKTSRKLISMSFLYFFALIISVAVYLFVALATV